VKFQNKKAVSVEELNRKSGIEVAKWINDELAKD
jgi:hypothetical protein